jgi:predicted nucleic acid-binding protein
LVLDTQSQSGLGVRVLLQLQQNQQRAQIQSDLGLLAQAEENVTVIQLHQTSKDNLVVQVQVLTETQHLLRAVLGMKAVILQLRVMLVVAQHLHLVTPQVAVVVGLRVLELVELLE